MSRRLVVRMGIRQLPADELTCAMLAALLWDTGRARFAALGLDASDLPSAARAIASPLIEGRDFTPAETEALWRDNGRTLAWGRAIGRAPGGAWGGEPAETEALWRDNGRTLPWGRAIDWTLDAAWAEMLVDKWVARLLDRIRRERRRGGPRW